MNMSHIPVLEQEVLNGLSVSSGDVVLDGTVGNGGHSRILCESAMGEITLIGIDVDKRALDEAQKVLSKTKCKVILIEGNFRNLDDLLKEASISHINKALFDLGMRTEHVLESGRGFTFRKDEPLLMTFSENGEEDQFTAEEIINDWGESVLADIFYGYGEEQFARRIAKNVVEARTIEPIKTTEQLVEIISHSVPSWYKTRRVHFATKTFQSLRIAVNDELEALREGLEKAFLLLVSGGRIAVISFHSLEDRIVKERFRKWKTEGVAEVLTKTPIVATDQEVERNPRSRSAKLRILQKI